MAYLSTWKDNTKLRIIYSLVSVSNLDVLPYGKNNEVLLRTFLHLARKNYVSRSLIIYTPHRILCDQTEEYDMIQERQTKISVRTPETNENWKDIGTDAK